MDGGLKALSLVGQSGSSNDSIISGAPTRRSPRGTLYLGRALSSSLQPSAQCTNTSSMSTARWSRDTETTLAELSPRVEEGYDEGPPASLLHGATSSPVQQDVRGQPSENNISIHTPHSSHLAETANGLGLQDYPSLHRLPTTMEEDEISSTLRPNPSPLSATSEPSLMAPSADEPKHWWAPGSASNWKSDTVLHSFDSIDDNIDTNIELGRNLQRPAVGQNNTSIWGQFYDLKPLLERRHILMISISGLIGTGIFVNTGEILLLSGSFGALLVYIFTGLVVHSVMACIGEMVALIPEAGALQEYPTRFLDDALGWTVALVYWFTYAMGITTLTTSTALFVDYWGTGFPVGWVITIVLVVVIAINAFGVKFYGEFEYVSGILKVMLVVGVIIAMLCINRGAGPSGKVHGVDYWQAQCRFTNRLPTNSSASDVPQWNCTDTHIPRPRLSAEINGSLGEFLSIWKSLTLATFSFIGVELVAVTAAEAKYPRDDLPRANRRVFWLTLGLYLGAIFFVSLNVPYTDWRLWSGDIPSKQSPFLIAITTAGIKVLPGLFNACMLLASWSTTNTQLFVASRTLYGMVTRLSAQDHPYISILARTTKQGVPMTAIFASCIFTPLAYLQCGHQGSKDLLNVLAQIQTIACLIVWMIQCVAFVRFYNGLQVVGAPHDRMSDDYPYQSSFQPWTAYFGILSCGLLVLFNGFDVFVVKPWNVEVKYFLAAYIAPMMVAAIYIFIKLVWPKPMVSLSKLKYSVRRENFDMRRTVPENQSMLQRFFWWIVY